jgi:hypothetical protein
MRSFPDVFLITVPCSPAGQPLQLGRPGLPQLIDDRRQDAATGAPFLSHPERLSHAAFAIRSCRHVLPGQPPAG